MEKNMEGLEHGVFFFFFFYLIMARVGTALCVHITVISTLKVTDTHSELIVSEKTKNTVLVSLHQFLDVKMHYVSLLSLFK